MALFGQNKPSPVTEVIKLRMQGLTDDIVMEELSAKGYSPQEINQALSQADRAAESSPSGDESFPAASNFTPPSFPSAPETPSFTQPAQTSTDMGNIYERIEEITESMIDEKWDELIAEVKKIIEWKNKVEEKQIKMTADLEKLKQDFTVLHQGVLGKMEEYDTRMQDVGTELKAVGKVFKDVIPTFVDNVKDLSRVTEDLRKKK